MSDDLNPEVDDVDAEDAAQGDAEAAAAEVADTPDEGADPEGADKLGDAGKKALDAMKAKWQKAAAESRAAAARIAELEAKIADQGRTEEERAAEAARREVELAALQQANARVLKAEIRSAATGKLANPAAALKFLDLDQFTVSDDGEVDADEITAAIEDLLVQEPYLAAKQPPAFVPNDTTATRKGKEMAAQVTREQLKTMTPEAINKARAEGRLDHLIKPNA